MSLKLEASNEALDKETFKDNLKDNLEEDIPNDELASKRYPKEFIIFKHVEKKTNVTISATKDNNTKVLTLGLTGLY